MLKFKAYPDSIKTTLSGKSLMTTSQLNKDSAFTAQERKLFGLEGKLPASIETLEQQVLRAHEQFRDYATSEQKHIYLNNLHDRNQVLFYKLIADHLEEMVPLIYTPYIAQSVKHYSHAFRQAEGLFLSYDHKDHLEDLLDNRSNPEIDLIVVTDGESILGIGDQGVGGILISEAKLMLYTLLAGISPLRTLPVYLDVGTHNASLLNDPFYLGRRQKRVSQDNYDAFIEAFVKAVQKKFPTAFLHWEDFGRENARAILTRYRTHFCTFNDDMQGTGVVTLAALLSAVKHSGMAFQNHRILIFGAGTAGMGIADQIYRALLKQGVADNHARAQFFLVDREGLLTQVSAHLTPAQQPFARHEAALTGLSLQEAVKTVQPTILIGCSSQKGAFTKEIIQGMAHTVKKPIIFPLSNPTDYAEAVPQDLYQWTDGHALIATGSPFSPVLFTGKSFSVAQCNNALAFPGIGLGVLAVQAKTLSDEMLLAAAEALSQFTPSENLLPSLADSRAAAFAIAKAVGLKAQAQNLARVIFKDEAALTDQLQAMQWVPTYKPLEKMED